MGAYSDPSGHTKAQEAALKVGDELIAQIGKADQYLIITPMYNFAVPAALKAWIDHVVRVGKTFNTTGGGYVGLLRGKKATVAIASMGVVQRRAARGPTVRSSRICARYGCD